MIKERLCQLIESALSVAVINTRVPASEIVIEQSERSERGDFACGIALKLASRLDNPAESIARTIADQLLANESAKEIFESVTVTNPGFLNFQIAVQSLCDALCFIHKRHTHNPLIGGGLEQAPVIHHQLESAYVRCASILGAITAPSFSQDGSCRKALIDFATLSSYKADYATNSQTFAPAFDVPAVEFGCKKTLVIALDSFDASTKSLSQVDHLAAKVHEFFATVRIVSGDQTITKANLGIVSAARLTIQRASVGRT